MAWHARLSLDYAVEAQRCVARYEHDGPLRILQTLYPEGERIAHNVMVHPPSGLVGGDTLDVSIRVRDGAHGLVTTPGAARFYRSETEPAVQRTRIALDAGSRFEWLPLESICYSGCIARNHISMQLDDGAEMMGWDMVALGLPTANLPFERGSLLQHLELDGHWLDRGHIAGDDKRLIDGPLGLAGHRCMASLFFATGSDMPKARREQALDSAREVIAAHALVASAGATSPCARMVVVRVLAPLVEPAMDLLRNIRIAWRPALWDLPATLPRTWAL